MRRTPALIVGGGPAGAACAIGLARSGRDHLLVERTATTGDALCGGFLSWRTLDTLRRLGIDPDALNSADVTRVRVLAGGHTIETRLPQRAKGVSRHRLDTMLLAEAERAGAAIERGVAVRGIDGGVATLADGGAIAAEALFLATGKHDLRGLARPAAGRGADPTLGLRVRLGPAPALTRLVGDAIELHLVDRGYAGIVLQEDGSANLCMAVHRSRLTEAGNVPALFAALGREQPQLGERFAFLDPARAADAIANVPYGWRERHGVAGLFRLGDQAGVIPSLAGEGMGIALASGARAAAAYAHGGAPAAIAYQRALERSLRRPLAIAGAARTIAESRALTASLLPLLTIAPGVMGIVARLTRVAPGQLEATPR